MNRYKRPKGGFTLAETLISLGLAVIVIAGVTRIYVQYRHMMKSQEIRSELQASTRAAVFIIARNINMARYGIDIPDSQLHDWITWVNDFDTNPKITPGSNGSSDSIMVAAAFSRPAILAQNTTDAHTLVLEAGAGSNFNTSDKKVIYVGRSELARVTGVSGDTLTVSKHPTLTAPLHNQYSAGDPVELIAVREFYINPTGGPFGTTSLVMENHVQEHNYFLDWGLIEKTISVGIERLEVEQIGNHIWIEVTGVALERDRIFTETADGLRRFSIDQSISLRN